MESKQTTSRTKNFLSARELQILKLYTRFAKKKIAAMLFIDYETVKTHLNNCVKKLRASNVRHATYMAMRMGLF